MPKRLRYFPVRDATLLNRVVRIALSEVERAVRAHNPARYLWAMLLARIYEILPLTCNHCGGEVQLIAFVTETVPIREVLAHIGEPTKPPRIPPPRAPPQGRDDRRSVDLVEEFTQEHFDYEFDQTPPWIVLAPSGAPNAASISRTRPAARPVAVTSPGWSRFAG